MYENWLFSGVFEGSSEAEFVSAFRNVRMADLFDNTDSGQNKQEGQT